MRIKNIFSTVAFSLAFALSAAFASLFITENQTESEFVLTSNHQPTSCFKHRNNSATADKISALVNQDRENGQARAGKTDIDAEDVPSLFASSEFPEFAKAVEDYVNESSNMKMNDLPADFQSAFRGNMKAWRDYSNFLNRMKKTSNRNALSNDEVKNLDELHSQEINRTWETVLETGASYGADTY